MNSTVLPTHLLSDEDGLVHGLRVSIEELDILAETSIKMQLLPLWL